MHVVPAIVQVYSVLCVCMCVCACACACVCTCMRTRVWLWNLCCYHFLDCGISHRTTVWLSTAPFQPLTHWYQVRLLLRQPLFVQEGQEISGMIQMVANER